MCDVTLALGQLVDGPSNGAAPLPWDIRCNPTQMFHTEIRYLEVPHTATIAVGQLHLNYEYIALTSMIHGLSIVYRFLLVFFVRLKRFRAR